MHAPRISLEQWLAFKTVVDAGSFAAAAEALSKSQSSISYAIARLNEQLPAPALAIRGRKAELTDSGQLLYRYAEQLLAAASQAEAVAGSLAKGFEEEVTLAADVLLKVEQLIPAFVRFSELFPHTRIRVLETSLSGTTEALLEKQAELVIGSSTPTGFIGIPLGEVEMLPVAAPGHPLLATGDAISEIALRAHRQVVLRDTGNRREQDAGWLAAQQRWTVSHFSSSLSVIRSAVAFGFLPANWVQADLDSGALRLIPLEQTMRRRIPLHLMFSARDVAGPATQHLAELIQAHLQP